MSRLITGIGGAFVDLTYHVSDEKLAALHIPKAGISFVDEATQRTLIKDNAETLSSITFGGSAANSICTARLMEASCGFAAKLGGDEFGRAFAQDLMSRGIQLATFPEKNEDTNSVLAFITPDGEKTFVVYPQLAGKLEFQDIDQLKLRQSRWIVIEGQLFVYGDASRTTALQAIHETRKFGSLIALNLGSISVIERARDIIRELLDERHIDLVIGNRDEYARLISERSPAETLAYLGERVTFAVMTAGPEGAEAHHRGIALRTQEIITRDVIDSAGAGDAFLGALLACIERTLDFQICLDTAHLVASEVVTRYGARLDAINPSMIRRCAEGDS